MRTLIVFATLTLLAGATPTAAQTFGFGAHAGVSLPTGEYADRAGTGFSGGLDLWYPLGSMVPGLSWYTSADAIAHNVESDDDIDDGFLHIPVMTGLRFDVPVGPVAAFATGQLGIVFSRAPAVNFSAGTVEIESNSDMNSGFGFNVGGGLQLTDNLYAGVKYYPLGSMEFEHGDILTQEVDVSFLDIYVGFGVR